MSRQPQPTALVEARPPTDVESWKRQNLPKLDAFAQGLQYFNTGWGDNISAKTGLLDPNYDPQQERLTEEAKGPIPPTTIPEIHPGAFLFDAFREDVPNMSVDIEVMCRLLLEGCLQKIHSFTDTRHHSFVGKPLPDGSNLNILHHLTEDISKTFHNGSRSLKETFDWWQTYLHLLHLDGPLNHLADVEGDLELAAIPERLRLLQRNLAYDFNVCKRRCESLIEDQKRKIFPDPDSGAFNSVWELRWVGEFRAAIQSGFNDMEAALRIAIQETRGSVPDRELDQTVITHPRIRAAFMRIPLKWRIMLWLVAYEIKYEADLRQHHVDDTYDVKRIWSLPISYLHPQFESYIRDQSAARIQNDIAWMELYKRDLFNYRFLREWGYGRDWMKLYMWIKVDPLDDELENTINSIHSDFNKAGRASDIFTVHPLSSREFNGQCGVCNEYFDDRNMIMRLWCDHTFHEECVWDRWDRLFRYKNYCPICRISIGKLKDRVNFNAERRDLESGSRDLTVKFQQMYQASMWYGPGNQNAVADPRQSLRYLQLLDEFKRVWGNEVFNPRPSPTDDGPTDDGPTDDSLPTDDGSRMEEDNISSHDSHRAPVPPSPGAMAVSEDLINFDLIETHKENIQSLPSGRSARALVSIFSPAPGGKALSPTPSDTKNLNDTIRQEFEQEIINISESDDPLDVYDRYVKWTLNAYPSAQATSQSQLLPLLERATKAFLSSPIYKNDPRYLKLWLNYIRFFSDAPRETFAFLARHSIGESLALFYEEFAAWLESAGRWIQAEEVYKLGIEREARPAERLMRKFGEFQHRFEQQPHTDEPSSPALPTVRPALAAKIDPFASASTPRSADPHAQQSGGASAATAARPGRSKMAIFSDADGPAQPERPPSSKGWENIGSLAERKKENVMEAQPWAGQTLKAGKKTSSAPKMMVFKDESLPHPSIPDAIPLKSSLHEREVINPKTGRPERVFVNLEAVYPNPNDPSEEVSFEELRAMHRGWLKVNWAAEKAAKAKLAPKNNKSEEDEKGVQAEEAEETTDNMTDVTHDADKIVDHTVEEENRDDTKTGRNGRSRKLKVVEVRGETQTIKTNLASPTGPKLKRKVSAEPTMTFHTRAATDEIYSIFNQPLKSVTKEAEEESTYESDDDDDDYTSAGESTGTGRISGTTSEAGDDLTKAESIDDNVTEARSVTEWSDFTTSKHVPKIMEDEDQDGDEDDEQHEQGKNAEAKIAIFKDDAEDVVTPISPEPEPVKAKTSFIPIPPEDFEPPTRPYRDAFQTSQNRLPFMTPIIEKTESSIDPSTIREEKDYFNSKTPSRTRSAETPSVPEVAGDLFSSPFQEIVNDADVRRDKIPQPALTKLANIQSTAQGLNRSITAVKDDVPKGPIVKDAQCNPVDDAIRQAILDKIRPPLSSYEGFFDRREQKYGKSADIRKFAKAVTKISKNSSDKTTTNLSMPPVLRLEGSGRDYTVKKELGKGAFAPVYLVENESTSSGTEDDDTAEGFKQGVMGKGEFAHFNRGKLEAVKMEDPPNPWEFYIMRQAKRRLGVSRAADSIIDAYEMHLFADEGYLIEQYRDQGTLLDLVNIARADPASGGVMDESLVMFFTVELFRTVEALHSKKLLHGDLKADNCLVRFDPVSDSEWSSHYRHDGTAGWSTKGVALIDFGRGIDMRAFTPDVQFIADWKTGPQDCAEMREMRPWTYQVDYHGLAGIVHSLLFGRYIETVADKGGALGGGSAKTWRVREGLKRYWQQDLWAAVFDLLLNPMKNVADEEGARLPCLRGMRRCRENMEAWLEANAERGVGLKAHIRRMENAIREKKR